MNTGITVRVLGDSGPFSKVGKSIGYMVTIGESNFVLDCGAQIFEQIGGEGLKSIQGLIITHCHDDHKRWFTDLAIYHRYNHSIHHKVPLYASEAVSTELCKMSEPALDMSLSDDSRQIVDISCDSYISSNILGPYARYRIVAKSTPDESIQLCIIDKKGDVVGPERAKIIISPETKRKRLLFRDPEYNEWIEPESFYPFSAAVFYDENRNIYLGEEGFTIEAIKAPVWHGIPNIGIKINTDNETLVFSSDTYHDKYFWKELCDEKRKQKLDMSREKFERMPIIHGDINNYIERTWSRERYEEAINSFNDAFVIHDLSDKDSIVHTSYDMLERTVLEKNKTLLTHSPDTITSEWALCGPEKIFRIKGSKLYEMGCDGLYPMNADIYYKDEGKHYVGYRSENGLYAVYEDKGMLSISSGKGKTAGRMLCRVELYEDISGQYFPRLENANEYYRERNDCKVEHVIVSEEGSVGKVVEDCRKKLMKSRSASESLKPV
jgi:ribonuclease BN (tRNA processing enzyme)